MTLSCAVDGQRGGGGGEKKGRRATHHSSGRRLERIRFCCFVLSESILFSRVLFLAFISSSRAPCRFSVCVRTMCGRGWAAARTVDSAIRTRRHFRLHVPRALSERQRSCPVKGGVDSCILVARRCGHVRLGVCRLPWSRRYCIHSCFSYTYINIYLCVLHRFLSLCALGMLYSLPPPFRLFPHHRTCAHHASPVHKHVR